MKEGMFKQIASYILPLKIEVCSSMYSDLLEVTLSNGRYVLNSANANYSFGSLHAIFKGAFKDIGIENLNISNCLMLGLGGGSVVDLLRKTHHQTMPITAVEIDPVIIELGKKYFDLNTHEKLSIVNMDALEFVKTSRSVYDMIVIDLYIDDVVPSVFHTKEFVLNLKNCTHKNTMILFNKMINDKNSKTEYGKLVYELAAAFGSVSFLTYYINGIENRVICVNTNQILRSALDPKRTVADPESDVLLNPI
jgi:spermidine synthase